MGGAVSSGRDNNELVDNLMGGRCIRSRVVEQVFRALDRAEYMMPEAREQAYKDLAWRYGLLHMSAPCIYSEVMEGLELRPGLSFLNIGSGTGYLSTLVGLILGSSGISHGVEVHSSIVDYSKMKLRQFLENSPTLDDFDFCEPQFYCGNGLSLAPLAAPYDRVYCGAGCPEEYQNYFKQLIRVGGILVMPLNDNLLQMKRVGTAEWVTRSMLNVSFATLRVPHKDEAKELLRLDEQTPHRLQLLCRGVIRSAMRLGIMRRHPELREPPPTAPPARRAYPRRICIPVEDDSDVEGLDALHDLDRLDRNSGAQEMNALLSLVLSMGHNRVAGALRFDSPSSSDDEAEADGGDGGDGGDDGDNGDGGGGDGGDRGDGGDGGQGGNPARNSRFLDNIPVAQVNRVIQRALQDEMNLRNEVEPDNARRLPGGVLMFELRDPNVAGDASTSSNPSSSISSNPSSSISSNPSSSISSNPSCSTSSNPSTTTSPVEDRKQDPEVGTSKSKNQSSLTKIESDVDKPEERSVPSEVEIYLRKSQAETSEEMDWAAEDSKRGYESSDDESVETKKEEKRQKLDSGIGEENTPSSAASSKSGSKSGESERSEESNRSDSVSDNEVGLNRPRRRLQKRGFCQLSTWSSSSTEGDNGEPKNPDEEGEGSRRKSKRRGGDGMDARRVRLSLLMKRGIKELPLPPTLKKYVNWGRCYQI